MPHRSGATVTRPYQWASIGFVAAYFCGIVAGHRLDLSHAGLAMLLIALYTINRRTRAFLTAFFPMLIYLLCYDTMHFLPREWRLPVHVEILYEWERALFGGLPHEFFRRHHWPTADVVAAVTYLLHFWAPIVFAVALWFRDREGQTARRFAWAFCGVNLAALVIQLTFPTAPPWYVNAYRFLPADPLLPGDPGALVRIDALIGRPLFAKTYGMSAIVFGAMPSMHAGWPVLMYRFARPLGKVVRTTLIVYGLSMWWAALYLQHHYLIDLLVGGLMALIFASFCLTYRSSVRYAYQSEWLPDR
ncbi:MAG: inositol phosphorylceramide synthase [Deltaproteobacteria bacterium]|nr:inositol phosphorylceramide synthase [Deltaproteobacteria bacterium]